MKYYSIVYPNEQGEIVEEVLSEQEILDQYWDYWYEAMVKKGYRDKVSIHNCIQDWIIVNFAILVNED